MMKKYCWLLAIGLFLISCQKDYTHNQLILQAESLMDVSPEKAEKLLKSIPDPAALSKSDYAAWCLHYTLALYKLDSTILSDSLIRISIHYYEGTSMYKHSGLSYYLLGYIYENQKKNEDAMQALKQAEEILQKTDAYNLIGLVYYQMGYLYSLNEVFDQSLICFRRSQHYFQRAGNFKNEAYAFRELANSTDYSKGNTDSVLYYFHRGQLLSLQASDTANYHDISYSLATALINNGRELQKAKQYLLSAYRFDNHSAYYYNKLSVVYSKLNRSDSAMFFFQRALPDTVTLSDKVSTFFSGAYAEKTKGNYKKAFEYLALYDKYRNLVIVENKRDELYKIDKRYSLIEKIKENDNLKISNRNKIIFISILLVLVLIVLLEMMIVNNSRKKEHAASELEKQKLLSEIEQKRILLLNKLETRINSTLQFRNLKGKLSTGNVTHDSFMDEMLKQSVMNESEWQSYIDEVDIIFNKQLKELSDRFTSITSSDKIVMALILLQLDITDSCTILGLNKNTMYRRRNTIKERLELDKSINLEKWLLDYVG